MDAGIIFVLASLLFSLLIAIVYFSKNKVNSYETKLYNGILILSIIGCIIALPLYYEVKNYNVNYTFCTYFLPRIYLMFLLIWVYFLTAYFNMLIVKKNVLKKMMRISVIVLVLYVIVNSFLTFMLPMEYYSDNNIVYTYGIAINYTYVICGIQVLYMFIQFFRHYKELKTKKVIPIISVFILGVICITIQKINPAIRLMTSALAFATHIMYFTIENPDVKMLEEFKVAKDRAEKANKEKEIFLYNITQDIRMPLSNIKRASSWINDNLSDIDSKSIKDGMYYINDNASIVLDKVNNVLDITNMEITNIKVYNTKYNIRLVLDELYKVYSSKVNNNVKLNFNIDSNIPEYLNGDSLRLKQLLTIILDNSCKYTDKGYVELNLNTIVKKGICRLIITIEDTGIGIKASDIENIFNKNNQNYNSLDKIDDNKKNLAIAKSIATLLGGILLLESEIGKGTTITFVLDQKIYEEKSDSLEKIENDITTYISKKKVMVIVEDNEYLEKVVKKLSKYDIDIIKMELAAKGLEYIRLNKECDLIIMDEELKYLSPLEVLNKFKNIPNFNIPVAILTNNSKYLEDGFNYILNRNLDNNELDNLINND